MRNVTGYVFLALSVLAWAAIAALLFMSISMTKAAAITTALVIGGEILFIAGIALLGKEAWGRLKSVFKST